MLSKLKQNIIVDLYKIEARVLRTGCVQKRVVADSTANSSLRDVKEVGRRWASVKDLGTSYSHQTVYHRVDAIHSAHEKRKAHAYWPRELRGLGNATRGNFDMRMLKTTVLPRVLEQDTDLRVNDWQELIVRSGRNAKNVAAVGNDAGAAAISCRAC